MRKAEIEIRWIGPDKAVREMIEDAIDRLFYELSMTGKLACADSSIKFTARVKETNPSPGARAAQ